MGSPLSAGLRACETIRQRRTAGALRRRSLRGSGSCCSLLRPFGNRGKHTRETFVADELDEGKAHRLADCTLTGKLACNRRRVYLCERCDGRYREAELGKGNASGVNFVRLPCQGKIVSGGSVGVYTPFGF